MWDNATITMLLEGTRDTLYMTLVSTFFGYVLGLPLGILLAVTDKEGIHPNSAVYKVLDVIVNILRSIPFRLRDCWWARHMDLQQRSYHL